MFLHLLLVYSPNIFSPKVYDHYIFTLSFAQFEVIDVLEHATLIDAWKAWMEEHINIIRKVPLRNVNGNTTWITKKPR